jgi:hypothetical protein
MMMARIPEKPIKSPFEGQRNYGPDITQQEQQKFDPVIASGRDEVMEKTSRQDGSQCDNSRVPRHSTRSCWNTNRSP